MWIKVSFYLVSAYKKMVAIVKVIVPREFSKILRKLAKSGRLGKQAAQKAEAACTQISLHGEIRLERTHHGESRVDCEKYDLGDGYRLITQRVGEGDDAHLIMLFVGTHDNADNWLELHKNYAWVRKDSDGKIDFIQVSESQASIPTPIIEVSIDTPEHVLEQPLLTVEASSELAALCGNSEIQDLLCRVTKGDWGESADDILSKVEKNAGIELAIVVLDVLTMADRGDLDGVHQRIRMVSHQAHEATEIELIEAISDPLNAETFYTWMEEEGMPDPSDREEWMLYLHPEQAKIAGADLAGPSRLRGVSGSGKTCVLVHRARFLAKKYGEPILVVTLTESMRKLLEALVIALCGAERSLIHVATMSSIARDVIRRLHPKGERWYTLAESFRDEALDKAVAAVRAGSVSTQLFSRLDQQELRKFLDDELGFIRTRLLPSEYESYVTAAFKRIGRGKALGESARRNVLRGLQEYESFLNGLHRLDHEGVVQAAVEVLSKDTGLKGDFWWRAVLADEVQDLSQNEIRLLAQLKTPTGDLLKTAPDGLFFVGDGAQTIYKRGFSLQSLGIQLARSHVFKKNYRNTFEILQAAYGLIQDYEFSDVDEDNRQRPLAPDFAARRGERPVMARCSSLRGEIDYAIAVIEEIQELNGEQALSDICLISRVPQIRDEFKKAMRTRKIHCVDIKDNAVLDSRGVRVSTIESAKGFEFGTVIFSGVSEPMGGQRGEGESEMDSSADAAKLYVAMTRARDNLHITYTSSVERGPAKALEMIRKWCDEVRFERGETLPIRADLI